MSMWEGSQQNRHTLHANQKACPVWLGRGAGGLDGRQCGTAVVSAGVARQPTTHPTHPPHPITHPP